MHLLLAVLLWLFAAPVLYASTIVVTNTNDDGPGSLRAAIDAAISGDTISIEVGGTIVLTSGELEINAKDLTIVGPGASLLTISGNDATRVIQISSGTVVLSGVTIADGRAGGGCPSCGGGGGGIASDGALSLIGVVVTGNSTCCGQDGGGIHNWGQLVIQDSTVSGNVAGSDLTGSYGGGIAQFGGTATIINSTISGNSAPSGDGGGIFSQAALSVTNGTVANNSAQIGGGMSNEGGVVTLVHTTLANNSGVDGGGVANVNAFGTLTVRNSLLAAGPTGLNCYDPVGTLESAGYNLSDDSSCTAFVGPGDLVGTPAGLDPAGLQNNGGPTRTLALVSGSAAVDAVPVAPFNACTSDGSAPLTVDQRGIARPQGAACDIGAFERGDVVDTTPPNVAALISGTVGSNGWYVSDVDVSWSVVDAESAITATTGCATAIISSDTAGALFTCQATSAGGTASADATVRRDTTAPVAVATAGPPANQFGWRKQNVTVSYSGTDVMSGIAGCDAPAVLTAEGMDQSAAGVCSDLAGNQSSPATVNGINIDKTSPTATVGSPADGAIYSLNQAVVAAYSCTDGLSGVDSCSGTLAVGQAIDTSKKRKNAKFTVDVTDRAGNTYKKTVTYEVR